jgi:hypothetical protein
VTFQFLKLISLDKIILKIKMSQHEILKIFPFGMSHHFIYDPYLGMACHGMSRVVTACHGISCDKGGVTHQQT